MTTATTILALLPVLTSAGRGADLMIPMALPSFGGMLVQLVTLMTVPVLLSISYEWTLRAKLAVNRAKESLGAPEPDGSDGSNTPDESDISEESDSRDESDGPGRSEEPDSRNESDDPGDTAGVDDPSRPG